VGVKVDPLGEALGASVLPEGFMGLGAVVELVGALPVVVPLVGEPLVVPLMAGLPVPPAEGLAAPAPLLVCASASVLESASAPANAIVMIFMIVSLVDGREKITGNNLCSRNRKRGSHRSRNRIPRLYLPSVGATRIFHRFQMRSITTKLTSSALAPSPGVR
jgi:hypothetical protein